MKVLVAGAGAVGSLVGGLLAHRGVNTVMVARSEHGRAMAEGGLRIEHRLKGATWWQDARPPVVASVGDAESFGPFEATLVAVKSYDTEQLASELAQLAATTSIGAVICLQNGVGNEARLATILPNAPIVPATVTLPAWIAAPGTVATTDKGGIGLGTWEPRQARDAQLAGRASPELGLDLDDAALRGVYGPMSDDVNIRLYPLQGEAMKWSKLLLNQLGAATSALMGWPPDRVFADRRLFAIELAAWRETLAVMCAKGLAPVSLPGYPVPLFAAAVQHLPEGLLHRAFAKRLAGGRSGRLPGVAADLAAGRRQSEITVLNGAVADSGTALGVPTPVSRVLTDLVLAVAKGELDRDVLAGKPEVVVERLGSTEFIAAERTRLERH